MADKFSNLSGGLSEGEHVTFRAMGVPEGMVDGETTRAGYMAGVCMGTVNMSAAMAFMDVAAFNAGITDSLPTDDLRSANYYLIKHESDGVIRPWADSVKWVTDVDKTDDGQIKVMLYTNNTYANPDVLKTALDHMGISYRVL